MGQTAMQTPIVAHTCVLDESVHFIDVQFKVKRERSIPSELYDDYQRPTVFKGENSTRPPSGTVVIKPTDNMELTHFFDAIEASGYVLVAAYWQKFQPMDQKKNTYYIVGFRFEHRDPVQDDDPADDLEEYEALWTALHHMYNSGFWRGRAYQNPNDGGGCSLSFNFDNRNAKYHPEGELILVYPRDARGRRILGVEPEPMKPSHIMILSDNMVVETWPV